jgi:hypothetical protein
MEVGIVAPVDEFDSLGKIRRTFPPAGRFGLQILNCSISSRPISRRAITACTRLSLAARTRSFTTRERISRMGCNGEACAGLAGVARFGTPKAVVSLSSVRSSATRKSICAASTTCRRTLVKRRFRPRNPVGWLGGGFGAGTVPAARRYFQISSCPERLLVFRDGTSGWTDFGSPQRAMDVLDGLAAS